MIKQKIEVIKEWATQNPKKVYIYAWTIIILSIFINIVVESFIPKKVDNNFFMPTLFNESEKKILEYKSLQLQKEKILKEFEQLKQKRDKIGLNKNDSLRVEYLYNEYNKLNNGSKNK